MTCAVPFTRNRKFLVIFWVVLLTASVLRFKFYVVLNLKCVSGCSPCCRGRDLYQAKPEDWWVYSTSRLWMGHGRVRWPSLRIPHGPHQLPAFYFPGLHTPSGESDKPIICQPFCGTCSPLAMFFWFLNFVCVRVWHCLVKRGILVPILSSCLSIFSFVAFVRVHPMREHCFSVWSCTSDPSICMVPVGLLVCWWSVKDLLSKAGFASESTVRLPSSSLSGWLVCSSPLISCHVLNEFKFPFFFVFEECLPPSSHPPYQRAL